MLVSFSYRPRGSIIEDIDPRARWFFSFLYLFAIVQFWDLRFLLFFFLVSIVQYALSRLTWRETRRAWTFLFIIAAMMVIINTIITSSGTIGSVMQGGHPVLSFQWHIPITGWLIKFTLTIERLWFGLAQVVRLFSIALLFMVIPFTMNPKIYGVTFRGMGLPDKAAFTMDLSFRFIPTLARDFSVTMDAQRARGYEIERAEGGLIAQVRKIAPLIVPITMSSILTGEDVVNAMDLRCFGLRKRTWIQVLQYHWRDYAVIAFGVILLLGSIVLVSVYHIGGFWVPDWIVPKVF